MQARIAVIGGGIVGTSIAYHLGAAGESKVVVFEADQIGAGSTARAVGGVRTLFPHQLEAALSVYSLRAFARLQERTARRFGLRRCGYLLLASSVRRAGTLQESAELAAKLGVRVEEISNPRILDLVPQVWVGDVQKAVFSPDDVCIEDPTAPALAYADLAAQHGVNIREHCPITTVRTVSDGFELVAGSELWRAERIVIALNAFAGTLLTQLGVRLASYPYPRHVFWLQPPPAGLNPGMPMTVFQDEDLLLRHDESRMTSICGFNEESRLDYDFDPSRFGYLRERLARRIALDGMEVRHAWSGLRGMTPDRRAVVGPLPGIPAAWCAVGCNGHGFMHAPAIGLAVAEMVREKSPRTFDLSPLDPQRFANPFGPPPALEPGHQ